MIHEPKNLSLETKRKIVSAQKYKNGGGSISCGHTFWKHAKDKPSGDIFLCTACCQYFVKMNGLPWWSDEGETTWGSHREPHSNHLVDAGGWYHPIEIRLQDVHGNTIHPS
jgi:hypothetical protein